VCRDQRESHFGLPQELPAESLPCRVITARSFVAKRNKLAFGGRETYNPQPHPPSSMLQVEWLPSIA